MATHARRRRPNPTEQAPPVHEGNSPLPSGGGSEPPSQEAIAARAYALFLARGAVHGDDWADWLQAEAELRAEGTPAPGQSEPEPGARG
jgi:hypothetical protein